MSREACNPKPEDGRQMPEARVRMTGGRIQATDSMVSDRPALCAMPLAHKPEIRNQMAEDRCQRPEYE